MTRRRRKARRSRRRTRWPTSMVWARSATSGNAAAWISPVPPGPPTRRRRPTWVSCCAWSPATPTAQGTAESVASADTAAVANVNDAPTGSVTIDDTTPTQGQTLNAANTLADVDGLGAISYQWQRGGVNIAGATGATYTTTQADVGQLLRVVASYTDEQGTAESVAQRGHRCGGQRQRCADRQRDDRRHDADAGPDADGCEHAGRRGWPGRDQLPVAARRRGHRRRHGRHVHDDTGRRRPIAARGRQLHRRPRHGRERGQSADTAAVANVNDAPTGSVTIDDTTPTQGQTLTAANTLADVDGLGAISYQWQRGGVNIAGATGSHLHDDAGRCRPVAASGRQLHRRAGHGRERGHRQTPLRWPTSTTRRPAASRSMTPRRRKARR